MTRLSRNWPLALVLAALMVVVACDSTEQLHPSYPLDDKGEDNDPGTSGALTGQVSSALGAPVPFAEVVIGDLRRFADAAGLFAIGDLSPDVVAVTIRKDDRTTESQRPVHITLGGSAHYPDLVLLPMALAGPVPSATGGDVALADGTGASFPAAAFLRDGQPFIGNAGVFMAATRPGDPGFLEAVPGASRGLDASGEAAYLDLQGVVWFSVIGGGQRLALADGVTAPVTLALPPEQAADAPEVIDVWQIDPATALWMHHGTADLVDGTYSATIDALRPICWATAIDDLCEVSGQVVDQDGNAIEGARVLARGIGGGLRTDALTDQDGRFSLITRDVVDVQVLPLAGNIAGRPDTVASGTPCPVELAAPLVVTLPDFSISLRWQQATDLDAHLFIADQWHLSYLDRGSLDGAPYVQLDGDDRRGDQGEAFHGRRWQQGTTAYWVHAYDLGASEAMAATGALVELAIGDSTWTFDVADTPFPYQIVGTDTTAADSSGWWHVFDIEVDGLEVSIEPVDAFAAPPVRQRGPGAK